MIFEPQKRLTKSQKFIQKLSLRILFVCNHMRTSPAYLVVAPAHRAYREYVTGLMRSRGWVFALVIIPVSSLGTTFEVPIQADSTSDTSVVESYAPAWTDSDASLALDEELTFVFDHAVTPDDISLSLHPQTSYDTSWSDDNMQVTLTPTALWSPGKGYVLAIGSSDPSLPASIYNFRADGFPQITQYYPTVDQKNFVLEDGAFLDVFLDRPVGEFDFRAIARQGIATSSQDISVDDKKLRITFADTLEEAIDVELILYTKHHSRKSDTFFPIGNVVFNARPPQPRAWPADSKERETLSVERTIPKVTSGKYIDINLEARLTTLFEDGIAYLSFVNSPGAQETPTPTGEYKIENKGLRPISRSFGVYLPYWMAFTPDGLYGIHDLVEWDPDHPDFPNSPNGGKESIASIDAAVSPGCVRHDTDNSGLIYAWTDVGTPVIIY